MSPLTAIVVTAALLVASALFVAAEFALVGARRHRLEQAAAAGTRGAKAALNGVRELSLMLAGAQLGITMVMIGLGMVSEPAFHHLLEPPLSAMGLPHAAADVAALVVALVGVTYLHVVVGEMAPKSWAIAHPERSAMLLSPPFRAYAAVVRWALLLMNALTNLLVRMVRLTPRDEITTVRNREQIHQLVSESQRLGLIRDDDHGLLTRALGAPEQPVRTVMVPADRIVSVPVGAGPQQVVDVGRDSDRTRVVVRDDSGAIVGAVHVRGALIARGQGVPWTAGAAALPVPRVTPDADLARVAEVLQGARAQLGVVEDRTGAVIGLVSMDDVVTAVLVS
ncbi:CBS domain containing-hemolysin-like protein [Haloactinopolyspora alba]|uniref:CBS domain containing-hemolysin-like protein n=1 Tax=Haloactinopolyspora alba TaxID=648780 RepID=A0A2P8DJ94_9ACTN|nr:hemolysin family protein [Haloactinopolyspora alba]PSK97264.1 CBS domain containing-hemolysin-like protein [Haloactinopolyspora alba]